MPAPCEVAAFFCRYPYPQRVQIVLEEKGLPYKKIFVDASDKDEEFLELTRDIRSNPDHAGMVPAIVGKLARFEHLQT